MFPSRVRRYQRLPVDEDSQAIAKEAYTEPNLSNKYSWIATTICVLCTLINLACLGYYYLGGRTLPYTFPSSTTFPTSKGLSRDQLDSLRRPSQFIGLDKVYRNHTSAEPKSFVNFPMIMAQIDISHPSKVTKPHTGVWTKIGTVYPEISKMLVSPSISTIVQFRALDFGMELCELNIVMPSGENTTDTYTLSSEPIQIYKIDYKRPLYADSLSHTNRPRRGELVTETSVNEGTVWTHRFECAMDEIYTFEFACQHFQDLCALEWTQDKEHNSFPAVHMIQYSTL